MIDAENQCCTLEQSRKLTKLKINAGFVFSFYAWTEDSAFLFTNVDSRSAAHNIAASKGGIYYPAYTVAELGAMLLKETKDCHFHNPSGCWAHYHTMWDKQNQQDLFSTQAECYADLLLYYMHKYPAKFNANTLNARLQKFYELKRIA